MITVVGWSELAREDQDLLVAARAASQKAFAPYSHFKVGSGGSVWRWRKKTGESSRGPITKARPNGSHSLR